MDAAFGENLIALLPNLRRFALSLSRKGDVADDLVQITVARAIAKQASFDPKARLEPWLFRIMRNAWIDMTRRNRSAGTRVDLFEMPDIVATDPGPANEARLMLQSDEAAMAGNPQEQREVLHLV